MSAPFSRVASVWRVNIDRAGSRQEVMLELRSGRTIVVSGALSRDAAMAMRAKLWLEVSR